eukprot:379321-Amphidinium_carterae.1
MLIMRLPQIFMLDRREVVKNASSKVTTGLFFVFKAGNEGYVKWGNSMYLRNLHCITVFNPRYVDNEFVPTALFSVDCTTQPNGQGSRNCRFQRAPPSGKNSSKNVCMTAKHVSNIIKAPFLSSKQSVPSSQRTTRLREWAHEVKTYLNLCSIDIMTDMDRIRHNSHSNTRIQPPIMHYRQLLAHQSKGLMNQYQQSRMQQGSPWLASSPSQQQRQLQLGSHPIATHISHCRSAQSHRQRAHACGSFTAAEIQHCKKEDSSNRARPVGEHQLTEWLTNQTFRGHGGMMD